MKLRKGSLCTAFTKVAKHAFHTSVLATAFIGSVIVLGDTLNSAAEIKTDLDLAADHIQNNAATKSQGKCAKKVREGLEANGVVIKRTASAKDYGSSIEQVGLQPTVRTPAGESYPPAEYTPEKGDVAIIQAVKGHPHGHMAIYTDSGWTSDFKQSDFWPNKKYQKEKPTYTIYRAPAPKK